MFKLFFKPQKQRHKDIKSKFNVESVKTYLHRQYNFQVAMTYCVLMQFQATM